MAKVFRPVPPRSSELLTQCQQMASQRLPDALKLVLDKVGDTFFDLANKADNSQRQNLFFDAMRELRLKRDLIEAGFLSSFNAEFEDCIELKNATKHSRVFTPTTELSLVDADDLEESLALTNFVDSVRVKCKEQLFGLDKRMGYLLSRPELLNEQNPVRPRVIGRAFRDAMRPIESNIEVKLTLFKIFDKYAAHSIYQMYRDINDHLIRRDVLASITATIRPQDNRPRKTRVIIETDGGHAAATEPDIFSALQALMSSPASTNFGVALPTNIANAPSFSSTNGLTSGSTTMGSTLPAAIGSNIGAASATISGNEISTDAFAINTASLVDTLTGLQRGDVSAVCMDRLGPCLIQRNLQPVTSMFYAA